MTARKAKAKARTKKKAAPKSDTALKQAVLMAALEAVPFDGFTDRVLARAGEDVDADEIALARLFPQGGLSLVSAFSEWADSEMDAKLAEADLPAKKFAIASRPRCWRVWMCCVPTRMRPAAPPLF